MIRKIAALIVAPLAMSSLVHAQSAIPPAVSPDNSQSVISPAVPNTLPLAPPEPEPLVVPPPTPPAQVTLPMPLPNMPTIDLDANGDSVGIAQQTARAKGLQGRVLWVDATANIARYNTPALVHQMVTQAKTAGFNVIVLDVKPLIGYTIYPSQIAPKLTEWKGAQLPASVDPLALFIKECHAAGIQLCANLAVFSEGHKYFSKGPGYDNPQWQTVLYEVTRTIHAPVAFAPTFTIADTVNATTPDPTTIALYTDTTQLKHPIVDGLVIVTDFMGRIVAEIDGSLLGSMTINAPYEGSVLVAAPGHVADSLRSTTRVGDLLSFATTPHYEPIAADSSQKITLFVNPNDPAVQQRELDLVKEVVSNYDVDGIIFDDRLRFAALNADFSNESMGQFEQYVGHPIKWPDDVFQYSPYPNQDIIKGPQYEAWIVWRALTIRNWLARARAIVKFYRPEATLSVYAGSWFGEYGGLGENWGADDYSGAFDFNTPSWRKTGFAGMLDWITTGCYYDKATLQDGQFAGDSGASVEGAGQLSNRVVNDQSWVYAGLYTSVYSQKSPDDFGRALQAAAASTQGVMVFDVSGLYDYKLWPTVTQAFNSPATAPHEVPGLLAVVQSQHALAVTAAGGSTVIQGTPGTGL